MTILDKITAHKREEILKAKARLSFSSLEKMVEPRQARSLKAKLRDSNDLGIIAEIKRRSPSKGIIHPNADIAKIATGYIAAGASALSVLTDTEFFGGSAADLELARAAVQSPILRKDFIMDEYQILEAKVCGADVILLIAACLTKDEIIRFTQFAHDLSLEVLLEVHSEVELTRSTPCGADIFGINNRDLATFTVSLDTTRALSKMIPEDQLWISESGIDSVSTIAELRSIGCSGFLIGEAFMKAEDPALACETFLKEARTECGIS